MEEKKISFCHFILFVICVDPKSSIQSRAVVVYPDQSVPINCSLNSHRVFSQWSFAAVGSSSPTVLVSAEAGLGAGFKDRFDFNPEDPDVLTLLKAAPQDAGRYTCKKILSQGSESNISEFSTEIIFLYGNMSCSPTDATRVTEGEILTLQCNISYRGNLRAVMEWRETDGRSIESQQTINYTAAKEKDPNSTTTATSSLRLKADRLIWKNSKFVCRAHFNTSAVNGKDDASPILQWTSPQFIVYYKPHDVKISSAGEDGDFYVGDSLTCSAEALPEAEFKWKLEKIKNNYSISTVLGNTFTIEEPKAIDETMLLTCTAKNLLGSANSSKLITIRSSHFLPTSTAATIAVSCVLFVLLAVLTAYVIHLKKNGADVWKLLCSLEFNDKRQEPEQQQQPNVELVNMANNGRQQQAEQYEDVAPVYASVHKSMASKGARLSPENQKRKFYVGADGTEYMDFRGGGGGGK